MKAILMSGPAGSGKSTWAEKYKKVNNNTIIISSDVVRYDLFKSYTLTREQEKQVVPTMIKQMQEAAKQGLDIIVDVAICKNKSRIKWYNKIRPYYKDIELVVINTSLEKCIKQNKKRNRHVPEEVIKEMYSMLEEPDEEVKKLFKSITYVG